MFTDVQLRYLEDVLGASAEYFRMAPPQHQAPPQDQPSLAPAQGSIALAVITPALTPEERTLLSKILASASIKIYQHFEAKECPEGVAHVIEFGGGELGRTLSGGTVRWRLPLLAEMTGTGTQIVEQKKAAWNWLQQFMREKSQ